MTSPIKPSEVGKAKDHHFPDFVIAAFNECITRYWDGRAATFERAEVLREILARRPLATIDADYVFRQRWLDVEDTYRRAGWHVAYERPGYDETYEPKFTFRKPTRS